MASNCRQQWETWLRTIDVKCESVIDIGGVHWPIKDRVKSWDVERYAILDSTKEFKGYKADYIYNINDPLYLKERFDVAFMIGVLEYCYDPMMAIRNVSYMLKPGGIFYVQVHTLYPSHRGGVDMMRLTKRGICTILGINWFVIDEVIPVKVKDKELFAKWQRQESKICDNIEDIGYMIKCHKI